MQLKNLQNPIIDDLPNTATAPLKVFCRSIAQAGLCVPSVEEIASLSDELLQALTLTAISYSVEYGAFIGGLTFKLGSWTAPPPKTYSREPTESVAVGRPREIATLAFKTCNYGSGFYLYWVGGRSAKQEELFSF